MNSFNKGQTIVRSGVPFKVRKTQGDVLHLENVVTGEISSVTSAKLLREYTESLLLVEQEPKHADPHLVGRREFDADAVLADRKRALAETRRRISYIEKIGEEGGFGQGLKGLKAAIATVAAIKGETAPHASTIYRWYGKFIAARRDARALVVRIGARGARGQYRLHAALEGIIREQIDEVYLDGHAGCAEDVMHGVDEALKTYNKANNTSFKAPSLRTLQRRLAEVAAYDLTAARFSTKQAQKEYGFVGRSRKVNSILELVEIDHSPLDILVVNEAGIVIGRPTITVILDRRSRCVLGFVISLSGHGTDIVLAALRHALLPKTYLSTRFPDLKLDWPCHGWPLKVLMDNGLEFHADAVADALLVIGITSEFAASRSPNDKPHVERFLKTLNYSLIHKLPGTTLAKHHLRKGFKSEDEASVTLEELDKIVHVWICEKYHNRPHRGLNGQSPLQVWQEDAKTNPPTIKANKDVIDIEFGQVTDSAVQHYGIDLNSFVYQSPALSALRALLPKKRRVLVKWNRTDVGRIHVWDPVESTYLRVPNQDTDFDGLSLDQAKAVKRARAEGSTPLDQFATTADAVIREIVQVGQQDKKLKARRASSRLSGARSAHAEKELPPERIVDADLMPSDIKADVLSFVVDLVE